MLVVQPAEEVGAGAKAMREDDSWGRFGLPDCALTFHVSANNETGFINVSSGSPYAGAYTVVVALMALLDGP